METDNNCVVCRKPHALLTKVLGLCPNCARSERGLSQARIVHASSRRHFGLPPAQPRTTDGVLCTLCASSCRIGEGERGFCGLRTAQHERLRHLAGTPRRGVLHWYRDPLPTNCVADWVCAGNTQCGKHNLAVFYTSCTLDCLFCQNWHFREVDVARTNGMTAEELADCANPHTFCVCYFGGDPASQMPHALASAKLLAGRGVTVCWETAGTSNPRLLDRAIQLSLESGGCIKFDLKAYTEALHITLTGWSNRQTLANFTRATRRFHERRNPPLVIASTLLVPGYVDQEEVGRIARFIAEKDCEIPYALLGFAPNFLMRDLPPTSVRHAEAARQAALDAGLRNVRIGNRHLLGHDY
ncbi:MAG: radical SAM protein [Candidatus Zixiibacteriota bacterium]